MQINILHLIEGARRAAGLTVIIDVFRAFSTVCYAIANGAEKIIPVGSIEAALQLKEHYPEYILMGERAGKKLDGFDYGNSPAEIESVDFTNRTIIHTTSSGTRGIVNAVNADEVITGSFVNAGSVIDYIRKRDPGEVSLVCMGDSGVKKTAEDLLCAQYIRDSLEGSKPDFKQIVETLQHDKPTQKFFDDAQPWFTENDFWLCLQLNKFYFVLRAEKVPSGLIVLYRVSA